MNCVSTTKSRCGKVGRPAFGLSTFPGPRRGGGNVGIAPAISKGCGRRGKPAVGFPRCPQPVTSTAVFHALFCNLILPNNSSFAACIRKAEAVSLSPFANFSRSACVVPAFKCPARSGNCRRISQGVAYHRYTLLCLLFALVITSGTPQGR